MGYSWFRFFRAGSHTHTHIHARDGGSPGSQPGRAGPGRLWRARPLSLPGPITQASVRWPGNTAFQTARHRQQRQGCHSPLGSESLKRQRFEKHALTSTSGAANLTREAQPHKYGSSPGIDFTSLALPAPGKYVLLRYILQLNLSVLRATRYGTVQAGPGCTRSQHRLLRDKRRTPA